MGNQMVTSENQTIPNAREIDFGQNTSEIIPVSYTHLTLPTKLEV